MGYIYKIINTINRKVYVGQTIQQPQNRWAKHLLNISDSDCTMPVVQAMRELGWENFIFKVIEEVPDEQLDERENYWINHFNSRMDGYNSCLPKVEQPDMGSSKKKILKTDNNGILFGVYDNTRSAAMSLPNSGEADIKTKMKCIAAVLKGTRKSAYGYNWVLIIDYDNSYELS